MSHFWPKIHLSLTYISAVCSWCFYHVRDLWQIRHYPDLNSAKLLANALVSNPLDYCNSLLSGITDTDLTKLQHVQNWLAHVEMKSPLFARSVPLLCSFQWLPVKFRVDFKTCLLTYMTLQKKNLFIFHSMLVTSLSSHSLRPNKGITLLVLRVKANTGARALHSAAPSIWNHLLLSVCTATLTVIFRKRL